MKCTQARYNLQSMIQISDPNKLLFLVTRIRLAISESTITVAVRVRLRFAQLGIIEMELGAAKSRMPMG